MHKVNTALESAFDNANIEMPDVTYALRVHMEDGGGVDNRPKPSASKEHQ
jgi:hypothetical protein